LKTLLLDIETAPNLSYSWGLWNQNIAINQIVEPGYTLCWAAKWYGKRGVMFDSVHESKPEQMLKAIHELLDEADVAVHYNGKRFDIPRLNGEFLYYGFPPPTPYQQVDLLKVTRRQFGFASNKLDYVTQYLGIGSKVKHRGMDLWRDCMSGCEKSWRVMKKYNIHDVKLLEDYYNRVLPWITDHPNHGVYLDSNNPVCRNCGSENIKKNGVEHKTTLTYQRYRCNDCGANLRARTRLHPAPRELVV